MSTPADRAAGPTPPPTILEIRVHGVSNTPPHAMLGLAADEVVRAAGDDRGSFWVPRPDVLAELAASPDVSPDDYRLPPPGVRREAYSWGALARLSTVPFLASASGLLAGLVRAFWVLIIPFGLVNAAYWARRLDDGPPPDGRPGDDRAASATGADGTGSGLVRLFGWALTMLWTSTALTVTVGVVAARCYVRPPGLDAVYACAALPTQMDALARWSPGARTAALAAVAVVVVLGLALVGLTGAVRFDRRVSASHGGDLLAHRREAPPAPSWPYLTRTGVWSHAADGWAAWCYHLTSALGLVGLAVTVQRITWGETDARVVVPSVAFGTLMALTAARITTLRVEARTSRRWDRWGAAAALALAAALLAVALLDLRTSPAMAERSEPWTLVVTSWSVPVLMGLLAVLVVGALGLRTTAASAWPLLVVAAAGCAVAGVLTGAAWWWAVAAGVLVGYAAIALAAPAPRRADGAPRVRWRAYEGWAGCGPAVFLSLAAGFALVLSGAVVTGAVGWLTAAAAPERARDCSPAVLEQCAADTDPLRDPIPVGPTGAPSGADGSARSDPADVSLPLPRGYDGFAFASLGAVVALLVTVLVAALTHLVLRRRPIPIGPPGVEEPDPWSDRVQGTRRLAALAHRAEPLVAVLAVALWLAVVAGLAVAPFDQEDAHVAGALIALPPGWESASRAVVVTAFGLLVASVVLGGSNAALSRPWGLLWDLTCFLPRVAHPFAAPSYAERAVPELRGRIDDWLGVTPSDPGAPSAGPAPGRSVVLAAHSLGAVVSVATLLARQLADGTVEAPQRIALLTFGTQLRAYFGRFFPELFGPEVLGTDPVRRARLWSDDPWSGELGQRQETTSKPRSVVGFLSGADLAPTTDGPRWRSLWRRTDYLGFPVDAYLRGDHAGRRDVDHRESEVDATSYLFAVDTHGGDVRTPEYRDRLLELAHRLGHEPAAGGGGRAPDQAGPADSGPGPAGDGDHGPGPAGDGDGDGDHGPGPAGRDFTR